MKVFKYLIFPLLFAAFLVWLELFVTNGMMLLANKPAAMDFLAFYTGGQLITTNPTLLYNLHAQELLQLKIDPKSLHYFLPFLNPPFVAFFFLPLARFPLLLSYGIWVLSNSVLLLILCIFALKELKKFPLYIKCMSTIGIIFFIPVMTSLLIGQLTFVLTLLFFLTYILLKKKKELLAGLLFSLVLIKPHFFVIPFLAFASARRWKVLLGIVSGGSLLFLLSLLLVGWSGLMTYTHILTDASGWDSAYGIALSSQHSLQTFLLILFHGQSASTLRPYWILSVLAIVLPTFWIWKKRTRYSSSYFSLQYALLIIVTLLSSPHTHFHDLMLLIVVGLLIGANTQKQKAKEKQFFQTSLVIGYSLILTGYIGEIYFPVGFRTNWILTTVFYMLVLSFSLIYVLLKQSFDILAHMKPLATYSGIVETGAKRGRDLGFPTANIKITQDIPEGIYTSETTIEGIDYIGATFIGKAKTFNETEWKSETYLLDFNENIYDKKITVKVYKKLRGNKKFDSIEKLVIQMKKDIKQTREFFEKENN